MGRLILVQVSLSYSNYEHVYTAPILLMYRRRWSWSYHQVLRPMGVLGRLSYCSRLRGRSAAVRQSLYDQSSSTKADCATHITAHHFFPRSLLLSRCLVSFMFLQFTPSKGFDAWSAQDSCLQRTSSCSFLRWKRTMKDMMCYFCGRLPDMHPSIAVGAKS